MSPASNTPPSLALSKIGSRMSALTGVRAIMKDIIAVLKSGRKDIINLSAGNPVILPETARMWQDIAGNLVKSEAFAEIVGRYGASKGYQPLVDAIVEDFNERHHIGISEKNITITPGSQAVLFLGINAFTGETPAGKKKLLLPLVPDYTGYGGMPLYDNSVVALQPRISYNDKNHSFRYELDIENFSLPADIGAMCLSRPCNPTGNVISQKDLLFLTQQAQSAQVPLFIDAAYGGPYPGLDYIECEPLFDRYIVHCVTLSKAGLPGERVGFAIGHESIIETIESFLTNSCIHSARFGQALAAEAIASKRLHALCKSEIAPFYRHKLEVFTEAIHKAFPADLPWYMHKAGGGIFVWLCFRDLPMTDWEFYQQLKKRNVIAVPGSAFFPGIKPGSWKHAEECLRISLTASEEELKGAATIIGKLLSEVYLGHVEKFT